MEHEDKMKFDDFLNHIGLRRDTKLTVEDVKVLKDYSSSQAENDDPVFQFFTQLAAYDRRVIQNLSTSVTQYRTTKIVTHISKRDVLFAILYCCNPSLLHDVFSKLHTLGFAVPTLIPSVDSGDVYFWPWGLRQCIQRHAFLDSEKALSTYEFISVSVFRLGDLDFSKSDVLNKLMVKLQNVDRCYTSYVEDPEHTEWSKGTLEFTWQTDSQQDMPSKPSFLLLNLRGDGLKFTRQRSFCSSFSQIQIICLSQHSDKVLKELNTITETSQVIVLTDIKENIKISSEEGVTILYCQGLSSQEMAKRLLQSLVEKLEYANKRFKCSINDISEASIKLDFVDDEKQFHKATGLVKEVEYYISSNFDECKEQMFLFTNYCKSVDSLKDLIINENVCKQKLYQYPLESLPKHLEKLLPFFALTSNEQQVFLKSFHLCLEQKYCQRIQKYMDTYKAHFGCASSCNRSNKHTEPQNELKLNVDNVSSSEEYLLKSLNENTLKVEHFMRALWQLLRSSHPKIKNCFNNITYSECIKNWLLNGNSVEIINFDSCHMPSAWAQAVLTALQFVLKDDCSVRVVSAIGEKETPNSVLLNHLFGANFTETDNLCPGGLRMQIIPIQHTSESSLGFDYLLLLNMKIVSLAETILGSYSEMREFLLTTMSSITNVLLIDTDRDEPEESILFDMIVHSVLKNTCSVVDKCCIVYHVTETESITLTELEINTLNTLKQTCSKTEVYSPTQTNTERNDLYKKLQDIVSVKMVPRLQNSLSSNQDYVQRLYGIKTFILHLLKQVRREAFNFKRIRETISTQTSNALGKANSSLQTRFYKFVNASIEMRKFFEDCVYTLKQTISQTILSASKKIVNVDDVQEALNRTMMEMQKFISNEIEKLRNYLVSTGEMNKSISGENIDIISHWLKRKEKECSSNLPKELERAFKVAKENAENDYIIEMKVKELLDKMMKVQDDDSSSTPTREPYEACIKQYFLDISNQYPKATISEIKSRINHRITDELKHTKYGSHVTTLANATVLDAWFRSSQPVVSTEDVRKLEKRFNNVDQSAEQLLCECEKSLQELSDDYVNFTTNSEKAMELLKTYLRHFQVTVNSLTMCSFLCIKFISSTHRNHVKADLQSTTLSAAEIDFETYEIKHVEPLHFSSLGSKVNHMVSLFDTLFTGDEFAYLTKTLQSKNITNYDHIPFNLLTLQRLDSNFLFNLPVMSLQNMNNILEVVNDAKLYFLGITLAKSSYDIDESFQKVFNLIKNSLINGQDSERIKAAAFVHVSAWSSALISAKEYQTESSTNIAYRLKELVPILKLGIKIFIKQTKEEEFAEILRDAVETSLLKCIPLEFQRRLREFLLQKNFVFILKRSLIGQMLRSFCNKDNFQQFISFVDNYDHCSSKWILLYLVKKINNKNNSSLWKLKNDVIEEQIKRVIQAVKQTTSYCVKTSNYSIFSWIQTFKTYFLDLNDMFEHLDKNLQFNDICVFSDHCCGILSNYLKDRLKEKIEIPEQGNVDSTKTFLFSLSRNMHEELASNVIGCVEQCPLCGNVCEYDLAVHEVHSIMYHLPVGIKGGSNRESDELMSLTCPYLVSKENVFTSLEVENDDVSNLTTLMKTLHPTWQVRDAKQDPTVFWKYIFNRFNQQFAEYYECREANLPSEWKNYSKEDAIRSVAIAYKLEKNEFTFS